MIGQSEKKIITLLFYGWWRKVGYLYLGISILSEVMATNLLKASDGFSKLNISLLCVVSYVVCFFTLSKALNYIPLNIAYALWGALGILVITLISVFYWKEAINSPTIIGVVLIIVGTVLINVYGSAHQSTYEKGRIKRLFLFEAITSNQRKTINLLET